MSDVEAGEGGWSAERTAVSVPTVPPPLGTGPEEPAGPDPITGAPAPGPAAERSSGLRSTVEWVVIIAIALIGAIVIRTVLFQAFFIPSGSMIPTLKVHDRILVNKLSYDLHPVHRGDIVVFKRSPNMVSTDKDLVKRVIGLPGDTISTRGGRIAIDGKVLAEHYLPAGTVPGPPIIRVAGCLPGPPDSCTIPAGHYFVMGDNRGDSTDSRVFGPIAKSQIVGRAFIVIWPLSDFGLL